MIQPIAYNHPLYTENFPKWKKCRDACAGSDAIKAAGKTYLPPLSSHETTRFDPLGKSRYESYLFRALFYNASKRTKTGLTGAANLRPPKITTTSDRSKDFAKKVASLRYKITEEQIEVSRLFALISMSDDNIYTSLWKTESIVNWGWEMKAGEWELRFIVLEDSEEDFGQSILMPETSLVRHLYYLNDASECTYQKWIFNSESGKWLQSVEDTVLKARGGRPVNFIPGVMINATGVNDPDIEEPVLLDLVEVNLSHYMNSADIEHGRHWTALPTAYASGFPTRDDNNNPIVFTVGSEVILATDIPGASMNYLEFSGAGLGHLQTGMEQKQAMMAVLGARILEEQKAATEAADTIKTRLTGEKSVLSRIAAAGGDGMTAILHMMLFMDQIYEMDNSVDIIALNTDFLDGRMSPAELQALTATLQSGGISYSTYFALLQNADIIPQDRTEDDEIAKINEGLPGANKGQEILDPLDPEEDPEDNEDETDPEKSTDPTTDDGSVIEAGVTPE